jgi:hypothetical protein
MKRGVWIDDIKSITSTYLGKGNESYVYKSKDNRYAIKLNRLSHVDEDHPVEEFFDRMNAYNEVFTPLREDFIGVTENKDGEVCMVFK